MLSNTLRLNFYYLKIIYIFDQRYSWDYTINLNENEDKNENKIKQLRHKRT